MGEDNIGKASPWLGGLLSLIHCGECNALYQTAGSPCPICGHQIDMTPPKIELNGVEHELPVILQGAIPWSTYVLIDQMRLEWERPLAERGPAAGRSAQRLVIVILFWTMFEVLIERFYEAAFADLPGQLGEELLQRFASVGSRLDRLYRRRWATTFWDDLASEGYPDAAAHLKLVQERRNAFVHGDPEAIDDSLVTATVDRLREVQLGWVAVFNKRCTGMQRKVPIWQADTRRTR